MSDYKAPFIVSSVLESDPNKNRSMWNGSHDLQDNEITITKTSEGDLYIEVEEEIAMDSFNTTVKCSITIPAGDVPQLLEWLQKVTTPIGKD